MLVLTRKIGESLKIGDGITVSIRKINGGRVSIGIEAPEELRITRGDGPADRAIGDRPQAKVEIDPT